MHDKGKANQSQTVSAI